MLSQKWHDKSAYHFYQWCSTTGMGGIAHGCICKFLSMRQLTSYVTKCACSKALKNSAGSKTKK